MARPFSGVAAGGSGAGLKNVRCERCRMPLEMRPSVRALVATAFVPPALEVETGREQRKFTGEITCFTNAGVCYEIHIDWLFLI